MKDILRKIKNKTLDTFRKDDIPSYETKRAIINDYKEAYGINTFIETGTFLGDTVDFFKDKFETLYSIELSEELANKAIKRFERQKNTTIIQGDSGIVLAELVQKLDKPALFWLDGHYSSEFFIGDEFIKTAKSDKNTPILKELEVLMKSPLAHIILIDDARLFNGKLDYPYISELKEIIKQTKPDYRLDVETDIIRIAPKADKKKVSGLLKRKAKTSQTTDWRVNKEKINKEYIKSFLPERPVVIDAGAHIGLDSIELIELIPNAEIHAFEPVPGLFKSLQSNMQKYPQVSCYEIALSNHTGTQVMFISSGGSDASSSLLAPLEHLNDHPDTYFEEKIDVKTMALDDWARDNNIGKVDFLWLDMQGFELDVLKASKVILPTVKVIHMEVSTKKTYEQVPLYPEVKDYLQQNGFKVVLEAIPEGWDMGNVLFVK